MQTLLKAICNPFQKIDEFSSAVGDATDRLPLEVPYNCPHAVEYQRRHMPLSSSVSNTASFWAAQSSLCEGRADSLPVLD